MKTISIINQKGGVGKTTTAINLSYGLYEKGNKVLMVDLDSQGSLTRARGISNPDDLNNDLSNLFNKLMSDMEYDTKKSIIKIKEGLDILPCNIKLTSIENRVTSTLSREYLLRDILNQIENDYDYAVIDCSPSLNIFTINALTTTDEIVIPITPSGLSMAGAVDLLKSITKVKNKINHNLNIAGMLLTMVDKRSNYVKEFIENINKIENINIFQTEIPCSVKAIEPLKKGISAIEHDRNSKISKSYLLFTDELINNAR